MAEAKNYNLGKGKLSVAGEPAGDITSAELPSLDFEPLIEIKTLEPPKGPAYLTHCLRRKQRKSVPHATFRRYALESTSYNVLLPFLEEQDVTRAQAYMAAVESNAANMDPLLKSRAEATVVAAKRPGVSLRPSKRR